jgi:hypothetical protein
LLLGACGSCLASTPEIQQKLQAAIDEIRGAAVVEPVLRARFANAAEAYWANFDSRIRTLTDEENRYLDEVLFPSEAQSHADRYKLMARINSVPYALRQVKEFSSGCRKRHQELVRVIGNGRDERLGWLRVAGCYSQAQLQPNMIKLGLSNGRADGAFQMQLIGPYTLSIIAGKIADALTE